MSKAAGPTRSACADGENTDGPPLLRDYRAVVKDGVRSARKSLQSTFGEEVVGLDYSRRMYYSQRDSEMTTGEWVRVTVMVEFAATDSGFGKIKWDGKKI